MVPVFAALDVQPINVPQLVAITLSLTLFIIPVLGATIRFAVKPVIDALLKAGVIGTTQTQAAALGNDKQVELLSRRVLELEQALEKVKSAQASVDPVEFSGIGTHQLRARE